MTGFKADYVLMEDGTVQYTGDFLMENGRAELAYGEDVRLDKIRRVLNTNKGEWPLNPEEGIHFKNILTKNPDADVVRSEITQGIQQVDASLQVIKFDMRRIGRMLTISFTAVDGSGKTIEEVIAWR